jgi:ferritin-like protein
MGLLATQFAQPNEELLRELKRAYADEWFGHYNYNFVGHMVSGPSASSTSALLKEKSEEALRRADRLAVRLIELGSGPIPKLTDLMEAASDKPFKLPEDFSDVDGLLKAVLDAERTSVRTHQRILELTRDGDPLTSMLALSLLDEAVRGEHQLERLLGQQAPEMTGQ